MTSEQTLEACPFCGGEAFLTEDDVSEYPADGKVWHVTCLDSCVVAPGVYGQETKEEAIRKWNTRAAKTQHELLCDTHQTEFTVFSVGGCLKCWQENECESRVSANVVAPTLTISDTKDFAYAKWLKELPDWLDLGREPDGSILLSRKVADQTLEILRASITSAAASTVAPVGQSKHHKYCSSWTVTTSGDKKPCDCVCECTHSMSQHIRPGEHYWYEDCAVDDCPCVKFTAAAPLAARQDEAQCYWCKHPDHGNTVCPVPHLATGEHGNAGSFPCGCRRSTVLPAAKHSGAARDLVESFLQEVYSGTAHEHRRSVLIEFADWLDSRHCFSAPVESVAPDFVNRDEAAKMAFDTVKAVLESENQYTALQVAAMVAANLRHLTAGAKPIDDNTAQ